VSTASSDLGAGISNEHYEKNARGVQTFVKGTAKEKELMDAAKQSEQYFVGGTTPEAFATSVQNSLLYAEIKIKQNANATDTRDGRPVRQT
jgi:hypothetical protein